MKLNVARRRVLVSYLIQIVFNVGKGNIPYAVTMIWAFIGVAVANLGEQGIFGVSITVAVVTGLILLATRSIGHAALQPQQSSAA